MAKNTLQASHSFFIAAAICLVIELIIVVVGILLYSKDPTLQPDMLFAHILDNYSYVGFKGMVVAGVLAMVMSTSDCVSRVQRMFTRSLKCRENLYVTI